MNLAFQTLLGSAFLLLLLYACLTPAIALAQRAVGAQGAAIRTLAALTLACVYLTLIFHALMLFGIFDRTWAAAALLGTIAIARAFGIRRRDVAATTRRDLRSIRRMLRTWSWKPVLLVHLLAAFFAALTAARAFTLPTVGWDAITYHFVKVGMWVQSGQPSLMRAPGGWHWHRSLFGGGEIFTAWAMLPFGNDTLACSVDLVWWGLCALALFALGREFGCRVRQRLAALVYVCFLPAVWDAVGSGYVDLANTALSLTGLAFAIRFLRTRRPPLIALSLLALALASGIKLTAALFLAATAAVLLLSALRNRPDRRPQILYFSIGAGVGALLIGPWLLRNLLETGYPLSLPISVGGIRLGPAPPSTWFGQREVAAYTFAAEFHALRGLFDLPSVNASHLSVLSLPAIALAPLGLLRTARRRASMRLPAALVFCFILSILLFFYSPAFSVIRLEFIWTNGRFLAPIVMLCPLLAFAALPSRGRARDAFCAYLLLATLVHFFFYGPMRLTRPSVPLVAGSTIAVLVVIALLAYGPRLQRIRASVALPLLVLAIILSLVALRSPERRYALLANRNVPADWFRYWWVAARMLDEGPGGQRIAVTGGDWQDGDNWLMYYFLGSNLQNTLHYVPISTDGHFIAFGPNGRREKEGDFDSWLSRIRATGISRVISFVPSSVELTWMDAHPERFERLTGYETKWALFGVRSTKRAAARPTGVRTQPERSLRYSARRSRPELD